MSGDPYKSDLASRFSMEGTEDKLEDRVRRIMKGVNGLERVREDADIVVGGGLDCRLNGQENSVQFGRQYREG